MAGVHSEPPASPDEPPTKRPTGMQRFWEGIKRQLGPLDERSESAETRERSEKLGGTRCGSITGRSRVALAGTLRTVTIQPRGDVPALHAELFDGTGTVHLIWLGRRNIAGITAGATIRAEGMVAVQDDVATMYNPRYELLTGE